MSGIARKVTLNDGRCLRFMGEVIYKSNDELHILAWGCPIIYKNGSFYDGDYGNIIDETEYTIYGIEIIN